MPLACDANRSYSRINRRATADIAEGVHEAIRHMARRADRELDAFECTRINYAQGENHAVFRLALRDGENGAVTAAFVHITGDRVDIREAGRNKSLCGFICGDGRDVYHMVRTHFHEPLTALRDRHLGGGNAHRYNLNTGRNATAVPS